MPSYKIQVNLHPKQLEVLNGLKRFSIFRSGRRTGKSYLAAYYLVKFALTHPNSLSWQICLDISTCTELSMPYFDRICPPELIKSKNRQTRTYTLYNGARVVFKTAETADSLRGRGLDLVILEEHAFWKNGSSLWHDVIKAQLIGTGGRALFISSPNGSNWARRLETQALELIAKGSKDWAVFTGNIYDNPSITREEIDAIRESTPEQAFNQEFLGLYEDRIGLVYFQFDRATHRVMAPPLKIRRLINVRGLDWGLNDDTACTWVAALENKKAYIYDEHSQNGLPVAEQARIIKQKTGIDIIRHTAIDQSCYNRDPGMTSVSKRFSEAGIPLVRATKDLDGSISDFKALLANGNILIDNKCQKLMSAMESWNWGSHEPDLLASCRYAIDSLVRMGLLLPPIRTAKVMNFQETIAQRKRDALATAKLLNANKNGQRPMSFRIVNL